MASIKKTPSGSFQIRVTNKLLPKSFWATFDTYELADTYAKQLEGLLAQGIVPVSLFERDSSTRNTGLSPAVWRSTSETTICRCWVADVECPITEIKEKARRQGLVRTG
jgi:hypothetical protein